MRLRFRSGSESVLNTANQDTLKVNNFLRVRIPNAPTVPDGIPANLPAVCRET